MDSSKFFHMNGGDEPMSYYRNSSLQKRAADGIRHVTSEALTQMLSSSPNPAVLSVADLGCSSGPNALSHVKHLLEVVDGTAAAATSEIRVYLNDLPTNDFNAIFRELPDFLNERRERNRSIYVGAYPGTFYGRLFPDRSLNFVYSFNSLHWLSRIPLGVYDEQGISVNKQSIYITERSPPVVSQIYYKQFQVDFSSFLKSRSEEVVAGGKMVILLLGRSGAHHSTSSFLWEILYQSLYRLVATGEVEEEKLESYEVHFYAPSKQEIEEEVKKEGSFKLDVLQIFEVEKDAGKFPSYGVAVAGAVRSIQESMMSHHFGFRDGTVLDKVFDHFGEVVDQRLPDVRTFSAVTVLTRL